MQRCPAVSRQHSFVSLVSGGTSNFSSLSRYPSNQLCLCLVPPTALSRHPSNQLCLVTPAISFVFVSLPQHSALSRQSVIPAISFVSLPRNNQLCLCLVPPTARCLVTPAVSFVSLPRNNQLCLCLVPPTARCLVTPAISFVSLPRNNQLCRCLCLVTLTISFVSLPQQTPLSRSQQSSSLSRRSAFVTPTTDQLCLVTPTISQAL